MSEPTVRCPVCCGLGRVADAPCQMCRGAGTVAPTVKCPACRGDGCDDFGAECKACRGTANVPACPECLVLPRDAMFTPCCGGVCLEAWTTRQRFTDPAPPLVRKAP